ncbi:hypothetical protein D3C75_225600 [compost metagenome]
MRIKVELTRNNNNSTVKFIFDLEATDRRESISTNAGRAKIILGENEASFYVPELIDLPHPDLCALAALKIISPYIGYRFEMDRPVSRGFSEAIKNAYPEIKEVVVDESLQPRTFPTIERPVVSFSGGADSVAAAALLEAGTPLILSARTWHPKIGEFEKWYNTDANIETLNRMPSRFKKIAVESDFEFLSTNGNYCIYPDSYAFTIPCLLLSDFLSISHIVTGDIWVAFNGDETIFNKNLKSRHDFLFNAVGLSLEPVINGIGELGSLIVCDHYNLLDIATTCQYGSFQKPCMKCIKCFRKTLYSWALFDRALSPTDIERFNSSAPVKSFSNNNERKGLSLGPSYKYVFDKINHPFTGAIQEIQKRMINIPIDTGFVKKIYSPAYLTERPEFTKRAFIKVSQLMELMNEKDISSFSELDYRKSLKLTD